MQLAHRFLIASVTLLMFMGIASGADQPGSTVAIAGIVAKPQTWTATQIKADFAKDAKTIKHTAKNESHTALAMPLLTLVNAAGLKLDAAIKNQALRFVVLVEGKDGYMAAFALGELMPDEGNREVWVAIDMDEKPLADRDAPATLIVPSDQKPECWVHGIKTIRVVDISLVPMGQ